MQFSVQANYSILTDNKLCHPQLLLSFHGIIIKEAGLRKSIHIRQALIRNTKVQNYISG